MRQNIALALLLCSSFAFAQTKTIAERLGYPPDSKLLILHADDLAVAHSEDAASFDALDRSAVTSASIMVPCPWLTEVAAYAKAHPDADLGLHLTLTSEWKSYRWGPVASKNTVPSLLDPSGYLWPDAPAGRAQPEGRRGRARNSRADRTRNRHGNPSHAPRQPHGRPFRTARSLRRLRESCARIQVALPGVHRQPAAARTLVGALATRTSSQHHRNRRSIGDRPRTGRRST